MHAPPCTLNALSHLRKDLQRFRPWILSWWAVAGWGSAPRVGARATHPCRPFKSARLCVSVLGVRTWNGYRLPLAIVVVRSSGAHPRCPPAHWTGRTRGSDIGGVWYPITPPQICGITRARPPRPPPRHSAAGDTRVPATLAAGHPRPAKARTGVSGSTRACCGRPHPLPQSRPWPATATGRHPRCEPAGPGGGCAQRTDDGGAEPAHDRSAQTREIVVPLLPTTVAAPVFAGRSSVTSALHRLHPPPSLATAKGGAGVPVKDPWAGAPPSLIALVGGDSTACPSHHPRGAWGWSNEYAATSPHCYDVRYAKERGGRGWRVAWRGGEGGGGVGRGSGALVGPCQVAP